MARNNAIRVEGIRELQRELRKLEDKDLKNALKDANRQAAQVVSDEAQNTVPRLTGHLARSIRAGGGNREAVVRAGGARVPYAGPIHFGWRARNITPQPFMYQAQDKRRAEVIRTYEQAMDSLAKKF